MLNVALTNLGQYNEGILNFKWLALPATKEEIESTLKAIGIDGKRYEEYFISDYETDSMMQVDEYSNLEELNREYKRLCNLEEWEMEIVDALLEAGYDLEAAIEKVDDCTFYPDCGSMGDVAWQLYEDGCLEIPEELINYFDFEAYGRDLELSGEWHKAKNGYVEVI